MSDARNLRVSNSSAAAADQFKESAKPLAKNLPIARLEKY